jgi:hypothetical protein
MIYHPTENQPFFMHFTIDRVKNDDILSIMDVDVEKMSRGFRTYKLKFLKNEKIILKPNSYIFFNENSGKVEERDATKEKEIHLIRIKQ